MSDAVPPACGFIERDDGTIEWGSTWRHGLWVSSPEPICVVYHLEKCGAWIPFSAWTRESPCFVCDACHRRSDTADRCSACLRDGAVREIRPVDAHDCDWIESRDTLYHHVAGSGLNVPSVDGCSIPGAVPWRIWIADGVDVRAGSEMIDGQWTRGSVLTDADLLAMGYKRVHGPTPDPFAGGIEGDTFHDERSGERVPDDDGSVCGCCGELFLALVTDITVVQSWSARYGEIVGLYRPSDSAWSGNGTWVAPLPHNMDDGGEDICPSCARQALSDFGLNDLLTTWIGDPDAMPEPDREALLDGVRERADAWIAGWPERRLPMIREWFVPTMAKRLDIAEDDAARLCEDAGY